ncbi:sugar ABC transporter permease [Paenibacillus qinlingensis]|uniref:ABC-type sugar transport system permease subunit n=1 Tax=Paenibacillus qinlingensis TaxID=1837343 RepID=A0ABU1P1A9_9BACL|nr:sugar ABC transporter permease [Paenibacillus qinlingensis]MDR6553526.1 ABC-type sugar transport system permease subunit [Paenibacillus qinlingensis]
MKPSFFKRKELLYAVLSVVPALVLFLVFVYYPLIQTFIYALTDWNGYSQTFNWVGLDNFKKVFMEAENRKVFYNTLYFSCLSILFGSIIQLTIAVICHQKFKGNKLAVTLIYIPAVISPIIVGLTWSSLLQYTGLLNHFLEAWGLGSSVRDWLGDPLIVKNTLIIVNLWQYTGMGMVIFLSGMNSIPKDIHEAAMLDGAVLFRKFRSITLPLLMPFITMNLFIGITGGLKVFELPFVMTNGGPANSSKSVVMSIYENAFQYQRFGVASAIGIVFFLFIAIVTLFQLRVTGRREVEY